ncbi:MAG: hypothetical protein JW818_19100 [Pirellulales bacterium]|nr:hypothetical protein [Pirellulales bacterium]
MPFSDPDSIFSLTEGSFVLDADYAVHDALAGGREAFYEAEDRDPERVPKHAPRGMPVPQSRVVAHRFFWLVTEDDLLPDRWFWPGDRCIGPDKAREWVDSEGCMESTVVQTFNLPSRKSADWSRLNVDEDGHIRWRVVAEPGWVNPTWLWPAEYDDALAHHGLTYDAIPVGYSVLRDTMAELERHHGPQRVRLILWFSG